MSSAIVEALGQLEAEAHHLLDRAAMLELEMRDVRARLARTQAAVESLRQVLEPEAKAAATPAMPVLTENSANATSPATPAEPEPRGADNDSKQYVFEEGVVPQIKRFRSTQYVADLLATDPRIWTFKEVLDAFEADGKTATMQNPPGAIRTALGRAANKGFIVTVDENHFRTARAVEKAEGGNG